MYKKVLITSGILLASLALSTQVNADQNDQGTLTNYPAAIGKTLETVNNNQNEVNNSELPTLSVIDQRVILTFQNEMLKTDSGFKVLHNGKYIFSVYGSQSADGLSVGKDLGYYCSKNVQEKQTTYFRNVDSLENGDELTLVTDDGVTVQTIVVDSVIHSTFDSLKNWETGSKNAAISYNEGNHVIYNGGIYRVLQSHQNVGDVDWNPESAPSLFKRVEKAPSLSINGGKVTLSIPNKVLSSRNGYQVFHNGKYSFSVYSTASEGTTGYYCHKDASRLNTDYYRNIDNLMSGDELTLVGTNSEVFQTIVVD